jgi:hypothetical protein
VLRPGNVPHYDRANTKYFGTGPLNWPASRRSLGDCFARIGHTRWLLQRHTSVKWPGVRSVVVQDEVNVPGERFRFRASGATMRLLSWNRQFPPFPTMGIFGRIRYHIREVIGIRCIFRHPKFTRVPLEASFLALFTTQSRVLLRG